MDNIKQLEKAWYRYKLKGVTAIVSSVTFVFLLGVGAYYSLSQIQLSKTMLETPLELIAKKGYATEEKAEVLLVQNMVEPKITAHNEQQVETMVEKKREVLKKERYEVSLEPIIPIVDMEKEERKSQGTKKKYRASTRRNPRPIIKKRKVINAKPSTYLTASELETINKSMDTEKLKKINLHGTSSNYIEMMERKFRVSKKPREALLLAKAYYSKKSYAKAEEWALKANRLDSSLEESWYLFAKSKAKRGQKSEAIKILSSFYKKSHAPKARMLIAKIKTERL